MKASIESVVAYISGGTHIESAKREAIFLAIEHECDTSFIHNDRRFAVKYTELLKLVHETPLPAGERQP